MVEVVPEKIRVSIGTTSVLGLSGYRLDAKPTTAYLMTYTEGSCIANCAFCPQARESPSDRALLSRVLWPVYPTEEVLERLSQPLDDILIRICIQAINYPRFFDDVLDLLQAFRGATDLPVSLDTPPLAIDELVRLREAGLDRISIPLDAATPEVFDMVKGKSVGCPYTWERHLKALNEAVEVFDEGRVNSNLIVGLGETEEEAVRLIQRLDDMGVGVALFAFTPIKGTALAERPQPPLENYRRIQLTRYMIEGGHVRFEEMEFKGKRLIDIGADDGILQEALMSGEAFRTSGCPGCNRPYYNERPSGPFYNYPRELTGEEALKEAAILGLK